MNEQRREFQHIRVDELQEQELYQDLHHHHHHQQNEHQQDSDIYGVYTSQNNQGVMLLREKRYVDAANCFCQAVKYVNERSMYNCQRHDDSQSRNGLRPNHNSACHGHRQRQSLPTPAISNENDGHDTYATPVTSSSSVGANAKLRVSPSNIIDSFYLLLDEENRASSNDIDGSHNNVSSSTSQHEGTYLFRNPIIVSKRGAAPTTGRNFLRPTTSTSASNYATNSSTATTAARVSGIPTTRTDAATTIDKESCAKLSLISVYNMALTYHLAALDNNKYGGTEIGDPNRIDNNSKPNRKNNDVVTMNSDSASGLRTAHIPDNSSTYDSTRPTKRQRLCSCNESNASSALSVTTTMTPFGECDTPYHDHNCSSKNSSITNNTTDPSNSSSTNNSVDHALLSQSLAYYEIAYRILLSEPRVLVSQAVVILNNIGHIHRLMGNEENAQRCFQRLLTTMIYLQLTGDSHQISHWDSFLTNVIDLIVSPEYSHKKFAPAA